MKSKIYVLLLLVWVCFLVRAQDRKLLKDSVQTAVNNQPDTLRNGFFKAKRFHSSFHMQAEGDAIWMLGRASLLTGFSARWVVNHKISVGAHFHYLTTPSSVGRYLTPPQPDSIPVPVTHMSVQLSVGYVFRPFRKFSIHPELMVGWSNCTFTDKTSFGTAGDKNFNYAMVNLAVNFMWNTTKYFRIGAVVGARGSFGENYVRLKSYRVGGLYAGIILRAGTF